MLTLAFVFNGEIDLWFEVFAFFGHCKSLVS